LGEFHIGQFESLTPIWPERGGLAKNALVLCSCSVVLSEMKPQERP
jgi:hypothetical protein